MRWRRTPNCGAPTSARYQASLGNWKRRCRFWWKCGKRWTHTTRQWWLPVADIVAQIRTLRVVPVIVIDDAARAGPLGAALSGGGLPIAEVTYRTSAAGEAIERMRELRPDMLVGAGTVLTPKLVDDALKAGAQFI